MVFMPISLILASQSPRRRHLLKLLGIPFSSVTADIIESVKPGEAPEQMALRLATEKAGEIACQQPDSVVIGADTVVVLGSTILGKPESREDARSMLQGLRNTSHTVITGVAIRHVESQKLVMFAESTKVDFGPIEDAEIDDYLSTGSSFDKAGSYGIQDDRGALFVKAIHGDFYNVMGLPVYRLNQEMKLHFPSLLSERAS
jgi:nucleoside triphosphate pyrophosphatase